MRVLGTNIISALGFTTAENYAAVKRGESGVKHYDTGTFDLPEAFMAALIDKEKIDKDFPSFQNLESLRESLTPLEKASILSVIDANRQANIDLSSEKTLFILSTTKGNVHLLENQPHCGLDPQSPVFLWKTATLIARFFKNPNTPLVLSNACISGAAALIAAKRALQSGKYDNAVVVGADFLSKFIISGFQSFKALSPELCRPFDKDRCGLNLGEAAACVIAGVTRNPPNNEAIHSPAEMTMLAGCIRNDANHISAPSRTGEGAFRALKNILSLFTFHFSLFTSSDIAFINAHGTATPYNDAMEVQAITRAGLQDVPVNSLKPFFGHTLGAAGILESIISMEALKEGVVLPTLNCHSPNFENKINIATEMQHTDKQYFIKLISGFGGVNAAIAFGKVNS